jgi:hypothetical protein
VAQSGRSTRIIRRTHYHHGQIIFIQSASYFRRFLVALLRRRFWGWCFFGLRSSIQRACGDGAEHKSVILRKE